MADLSHNFPEISGVAKREIDRDSLFLKAELRFPASNEQGEVRIRNLSAGGLMAEAPVQVARGEKVELNMRNIGWISGVVAWVAEGRIGIAFDHPIDPKAARKPVGQSESDLPLYLRKIDQKQKVMISKLRRV
jgi:PilZ domain